MKWQRSTVWRGRTKFVEELIELGADVNYRTVYCGWRPIHYAAWNDYPLVLTLLLDAGADINARTQYGQMSVCVPTSLSRMWMRSVSGAPSLSLSDSVACDP